MKTFFQNIDLHEFDIQFADDEKCLEFLSQQKWKDGYVCRKCGNTNFCKGKTPFSRRCTKCKHEESATSNTMFHGCKISLTKAFRIAFLVCNKPEISTYEISKIINIRQMTCWKFKKRITECIKNRSYMTKFLKEE